MDKTIINQKYINKTNKKAQVTIFIIIAIIIAAALSISIFVTRETGEIQVSEEITEAVPLEIKPIKNYVDKCIQEKTITALTLTGLHGGYIDMLDSKYSGGNQKIKSTNPTEADTATFTQFPNSHVPYWWYMDSKNDCFSCSLTSKKKPTIEFIEKNIDKYVDANLDLCINEFKSFTTTGFDIKAGNWTTTSKVTEKDIVVKLNYPLVINLNNRTNDIENFIVHIPIRFKDIYNLGSNISTREKETNFLEEILTHIISLNTDIDTDKLPPFYAREKSYSPKMWINRIVELQIKDLLSSYIPLIQLNNTKGAKPINLSSAYGIFYLDILNESIKKTSKDFEVSFIYLDYPIYFNIHPSNGAMIPPSKKTVIPYSILGLPDLFPTPPIYEYQYFYDVSFPVIVKITQPDALYGAGYSFMFALEGNIRDNKNMVQWFKGNGTFGRWDYSIFGLKGKDKIKETKEYSQIPALVSGINKSLFCSPRQRLSGNVTIKVVDAYNKTPINKVPIKYACGMYETCTIGETTFQKSLNYSAYVGPFPVCIGGGILSVEKTGFAPTIKQDITTKPKKDLKIEIPIEKIWVKNITVKKIKLKRKIIYRDDPLNWNSNYTTKLEWGGVTDFKPEEESSIITFEKVNKNPMEKSSMQTLAVDSKNKNGEIKLFPTTYKVDGMIIYIKKTKIDPEKRCTDKEDEDTCYFLPKQPGFVLKQRVSGGVKLNEDTGYWKIEREYLQNSKEIEIYLLETPKPKWVEDLDEMNKIDELTEKFRKKLEPVFNS